MLRDPQPRPDPSEPPHGVRPEQVQLRARRSPKLIALGVLLVALGGLGAGTLFTLTHSNKSVVTTARYIARGETITQPDLAIIEVPATLGAETTSSEYLLRFVGQRALADLPQGSYPLSKHFGHDPVPDGEAVVGLLLALGRLPTTDLAPGTRVRLIGLANSTALATEAIIITAPVSPDGGGTFSLNVRLDATQANQVAAAMAVAELVLVVVQEA